MEGSKTQLNLPNYLINDSDKKVSFFKHGYKNYQNFVRETRKLNFQNSFDYGKRAVIDLFKDGRYGDMITNITLEVELADLSSASISGKGVGYCNGVGHALIKNADLIIGGNLIDRHSNIWSDISSEVGVDKGTKDKYNNMIKKYSDDEYSWENFKGGTVYSPLHFWFCNYGRGQNNTFTLPLVGLNNATVELAFTLAGINDLIKVQDDFSGTLTASSYNITNASLLVDYIILEENDRLPLLNAPKSPYIISQIQELTFNIEAGETNKVFTTHELKYPVSELFWVVRRDDASTENEYFKYGDTLLTNSNNPITKFKLSFEGKDRIPELTGDYFTMVEPVKMHSNYPTSRHLSCYSFAVDPENVSQPSGVCNFSGLHTVQFHLTLRSGMAASKFHLFAMNYNVLQVCDGTASLLHTLSKSTPDTISYELQ